MNLAGVNWDSALKEFIPGEDTGRIKMLEDGFFEKAEGWSFCPKKR